ncbi:MAG: hypothetical protein H6993_17825 [Pseudomonadales bacterium]|nr:hypothetical protein [Pseudomonadales bacterium]MCP5185828.1 hypothetical protein [Pseudomonadales bacterium]
MSILTMASTKGGAGKTTIAQLIIGVVRARGHSVAVVDADPNRTISNWLTYLSDLNVEISNVRDENQLVSEVRRLNARHDLVMIDTAGARSQMLIYAIRCSDLVLIPTQMSGFDANEAIKTYNIVMGAGGMTNRDIPVRVVYNGYVPKTRVSREVRQKIGKHGIPALKTRLHQLVAFKEMTFTGDLPDTGTPAAQAQLLVQEMQDQGLLPFLAQYRQAS